LILILLLLQAELVFGEIMIKNKIKIEKTERELCQEPKLKKEEVMNQITLLCLTACLISTQDSTAWAADPKAETRDRAATLPLSEVVLYSSGVGYFQRDGEVEGQTKIDLRFKADDINDLLKSMVVQDLGGGRIASVAYGSRDPLTKTLKSFGIDLTQNPSLGQLLNQVRGEPVQVLRPGEVKGTILGVERKMQPVGEDKQIEVEFLNLLTDDGLQSFQLSEIRRIKLLNERLNAELKQALEVLASGHDTQKKTVSITFDGEGKRKVGVAYIAQTPVWKTSYRLVLDEQDPPYLQGWAIVENTTDEDWNNVQLSLVSGRPISFVMDLYQPLYTTRPVVEPELYLSLRPPVYGDAVESDRLADFAGRGLVAEAPAGPMPAESAQRRKLDLKAGVDPVTGAPAQSLARSRSFGSGGGAAGLALADAAKPTAFFKDVAASAEGAQAGELFQYSIKTPVTLARQQSAMLPIVSQKIAGEKVSIYNQNVQAKRPLNGFRLKNTTPLHLMQGPITVFEEGTYAGDARIEDLAPGQERLVSYALDLKTEVEPQTGSGRQELVSVSIKKGTLIANRKMTEERTYSVRNRDQKKKTILIEHPFRSDWKLVEPKEAAERTRDVYRFPVNVDPDKTAKLVVREENQLAEHVQLINSSSDVIAFYLRSQKVSPAVKEALQKVVSLRDRFNQTTAERSRREQRTNEISQEQARIRENMTRLSQTSDLYTRYVKKLDEQETELEKLRQEIETLKDTERKQQQELNAYLLNLDVG